MTTQTPQEPKEVMPITTENKQKKIYYIDASLLKSSHCFRKIWHILMDGYTTKINSIDIEYGQAFHIFAKSYVDLNHDFQGAAKIAVEYFKNTPKTAKKNKEWMTEQHLKKTLFDWYTHWENNRDELETLKVEGASTTELKFCVPYYSDNEYDIMLSGTIDSLNKVRGNGVYAIKDYKTTSMWNAQEYLKGYILDPQLMFYRFVVSLYAKLYPQSIYADMCSKGCGCLIEGIFLKSADEAKIVRSDMMFFRQWQLDEFKVALDQFISRLLQQLKLSPQLPIREGVFNSTCATKYGTMCQFANACGAPDAVASGYLLKNNFIQKQYNPLKFH